MPDRVDAVVNSMQPSGVTPRPDRVVAEAEPLELPSGNHAVLPFRQPRDSPIHWLLGPKPAV